MTLKAIVGDGKRPLRMAAGIGLGVAISLTGVIGLQSAQAVTVPDSSFESPNTGGSYVYNPSVPGVLFNNNAGVDGGSTFSGATPPNGTQYGFIQSGGGADGVEPGSIAFDVTGLALGTTYDVTFYGSQRSGYPVNPLDVTFGATDLGTFTPSSPTSFDFFTTTGEFTATASSGSLTFTGVESDGDYDSAIDEISVNPLGVSPAPEPATWVMMIGGVALIGAALRRGHSMWRSALA